jgi:hypothetical protein
VLVTALPELPVVALVVAGAALAVPADPAVPVSAVDVECVDVECVDAASAPVAS